MLPGGPWALLAGAVFGAGLFVATLAVVGLPEPLPGKPRRQGLSLEQRGRRLVYGGVAGALTLVATHWVVAGAAIGLLVAWWDRIAGSSHAEKRAIARLEALATWTESLRDTIAGAIGLEQAIPATAANAGAAIRPSLNLLADRLRVREPLPDALRAFAEDLDDPSADIVCASLLLNARLRGPGLRDVLTALAGSAREELDMRLFIVLGMMGMLALLNRQYVEPYDSAFGQLVLLVVAAMLAVGLMWLRSLAAPTQAERFLVFDSRGDASRSEVASV